MRGAGNSSEVGRYDVMRSSNKTSQILGTCIHIQDNKKHHKKKILHEQKQYKKQIVIKRKVCNKRYPLVYMFHFSAKICGVMQFF